MVTAKSGVPESQDVASEINLGDRGASTSSPASSGSARQPSASKDVVSE